MTHLHTPTDTQSARVLTHIVSVCHVVVVDVQEHEENVGERTSVAEWVFLGSYILEALVKLYALGVKRYFRSSWNRFDFFVVVTSGLAVIIQELTAAESTAHVVVFVRSLRLLRLIRVRASFRSVARGMGYLIPKVGRYVGALMVVYYVFAIIGTVDIYCLVMVKYIFAIIGTVDSLVMVYYIFVIIGTLDITSHFQ